ncbi:MAG TPA: ParB/RepB/Spo0J family partition protein [Thermodesulfobacteriota bacterium]|nr:ParB/RepB/Spo0J family partition protein [Thermodesulfobacteriota bacterium]
MLNKKKVLGRGLGALIGEVERVREGTGTKDKYFLCPILDISPNKTQPRKKFDEAALKELSDSIKEKGVIEPLVVRKNSGGFELIAGERRWRASRMAGLTEVPVVVMDATDAESLELAIIENIQREDLNAIEEAEAYRNLMTAFNLSQEDVAKKVGKERATVANYLRLLKLEPEVKAEIIKGTITMGHARALLSVEGHAAQTELLRAVITKGLSVRETEALANRGVVVVKGAKGPKGARGAYNQLEDELRSIFGTKVALKDRKGKGRIEINYFSADERERIIEMLRSIG